MKNVGKILTGILTILAVLVECSYGQNGMELYNHSKKGWIIPGLEEFDVLMNISEMVIENQQKVTVKRYDQSKKYEMYEEPLYFYDKDGFTDRDEIKIVEYRHRTDSNMYSVNMLESYEVNGKVFAYRTGLSQVSVYDCDNCIPISYCGCIFFVYYVDTDGNGTFETRSEYSSLPFAPDWVYLP